MTGSSTASRILGVLPFTSHRTTRSSSGSSINIDTDDENENTDIIIHTFLFNMTSEPYLQTSGGDCVCDKLWNPLDYKF